MKLNWYKIITLLTMLCCFVFPTNFLENLFGIDVTEYFFLGISAILYIIMLIVEKNISKFELIGAIFVLILCIIRRSITPLYLIELLLAYRLTNYLSKNNETIKNEFLIISIIGIIVYSIIYFGYSGRYIYTGLREINQCGFAIFMLFLIIRKKNKKIGNILLLVGNITMSRNYFFCYISFFLLEKIKNTKFYNKIYKYFTFEKIAIISVTLLLALSLSFEFAYKNNSLSQSKEGLEKYINIYDYSNYFRFTVNTKLLKIYIDNPNNLINGLNDNEFFELSKKISYRDNMPYRQIKPHNYFFSYLRIYGIFSILIFIMIGKIINKMIDRNNASILILIFLYASILGIGFANYWLFLSIITLNEYRKGGKTNDE